MALTQTQQIHKCIEEANQVLITFQPNAGGDAVGSATALSLFLKSLGKQVDITSDNFVLPKQLRFLKTAREIKPAFSHLQTFVISLDIGSTGVEGLNYDIKDGKLRIHITPEHGSLSREQIRTAQSDFKYDLIITVGTQDLAQLGNLYYNNTELFFNTPIVNVDNSPNNEHFGQVNSVDITASSTAEIIFQLLSELGEEYVTEDIATALLTGMIWNTRSFKSDNIKPRTLALASKLISLGGRRDYIVQNLYQTRTIASLKLWGMALANLQNDKTSGLVWTTLTREAFARSGAEEQDLYEIVDELISNSPEAKMTLLIHEHVHEQKIHAILTTDKQYHAMKLLTPFHPTGNPRRASCEISGKTLAQVEDEITEYIKKTVA